MEVRNRFKGLDLTDRVPDELWTEVRDIVQETGSRPSPRKRREVKSKGKKGIYTHLNADFQRITRRDRKAFLSDQCKEIEENNGIGKTRDLFKKLEISREHFMQRWAQ